MAHDQKREQALKGQGRNHTEIDGTDRLRVVSQECLPALRRRANLFRSRRRLEVENLFLRHQLNIESAPDGIFGNDTLASFTVITEEIARQTWAWRRLFHSPR